MRFFITCLLIAPAVPLIAQYNGPESVEYDAVGDRYFVSNTGSSSIKQRDQAGTVTAFASGLSDAPYGIELLGDTLYACTGGSITGFATSDGSQVFTLDLGGTFLNGLTTDGQYLYATDFSAAKIFRVDPVAGTFTTWVANTNGTPNGIVYDPTNDRLAVAFWGSNAAVKTYDRQTAAPGPSMNTGVSNIDGITIDCFGRYLISSWSPARVSAVAPTLDQAILPIVTTGLSSPADIDLDEVHQRICIPNSAANTVTLVDMSCSVGMEEAAAIATGIAITPSATSGPFTVMLERPMRTPYELFDAGGALVMQGLLPGDGRFDISAQRPGVYLLRLSALQRTARVVKY